MLNIGITMRVTNAENYFELRDSIAKDWFSYMSFVMPNTNWMLLPNLENKIVEYTKKWKLNGFIFSGGENLSVSSCRDNTELELFNYAQKEKFPILGICRGFQAIYSFMGGEIKQQGDFFLNTHRATKHKITYDNNIKIVNSFHNNIAVADSKPKNVKVMAVCIEDNSIEAFTSEKILAFQWHPEREKKFQEWDAKIIRDFFKYEQ